MKIRVSPRAGFTLIELLVVISIIAILAGIALPAFTQVIERGNQTKALSNAKQIYMGVKLFAGDYDGEFPNKVWQANTSYGSANTNLTATSTSNEAFRWIVPEYIKSENIFYLAKSRWSSLTPDENTADGEALKGGENHWAYVRSLTDTSNPNLPLIADGFSTVLGVYSPDETARGGLWKGKAAIVVRVDGSGRVEKLQTQGTNAYKLWGPVGAAAENDVFMTQTANWYTNNQSPLNPEPAATAP